MTFQKKGQIPFKVEMIKDKGQYFVDFFNNLPSPEPLKLGKTILA